MFADDIALVRELAAKHGPLPTPVVECGGLIAPTIADYQKTIDAMADLGKPWRPLFDADAEAYIAKVREAQMCRYLDIERPLSFLGEYTIENPETGGVPIEKLADKYGPTIGTAILLSVLEHVANPFAAVAALAEAMKPGGIAIVSTPWVFPEHDSTPDGGRDWWRFNVGALRELFGDAETWEVLDAGPRLDIPADAGVLQMTNTPEGMRIGPPQAIRSTYICARAL